MIIKSRKVTHIIFFCNTYPINYFFMLIFDKIIKRIWNYLVTKIINHAWLCRMRNNQGMSYFLKQKQSLHCFIDSFITFISRVYNSLTHISEKQYWHFRLIKSNYFWKTKFWMKANIKKMLIKDMIINDMYDVY